MTAVSAPLEIQSRGTAYTMADSDLDAEGDSELEEEIAPETPAVGADDGNEQEEEDVDSDANVEVDSEEDESEESNNESLARIAVRTRRSAKAVESDAAGGDEDSSEAEDSSVDEEDDSDKASSDAESVMARPWEDGSDGGENASVRVGKRNNCVFCGNDEEHDPSEEFEECLSCVVCGDHSHRQCARDAKSFKAADDSSKWRCPECVENALEPASQGDVASSQRRSSTSKFTRDLLPAARGVSRPGSHSVFNNLILDDDPLDGSRSLRKRKASSEQQEESKKRSRKNSVLASELKAVGIIQGGDDENEKPEDADDAEATTLARKSRSSRSSGRRKSNDLGRGSALIVKRNAESIVLSIRLSPAQLAELAKPKPKKKKVRRRESTIDVQRERDRPVPSFSSHYAAPFYAFHERENDELKSKPYGGVLSEADADTSKTLPIQADRVRFTEARQKAEEEWKQRVAASEAEGETKARTQKLAGPPSKIKCVNFGGFEIETWYAAPYPEEYSRNRVLYICEFCLKYMNSDFVAWRHKLKCPTKHPPGDEIYRDHSISVFEVDGRKNPVYCQNLCLLAKLFLGSKTLYYDVEPFLFYVMTEYDEFGCHFVGYFSKEKRPSSQNNVSCILTLPIHQRKGYGNLLISFSYLLTRVEAKTGSPEKPLSDMGLVSYRNYWRLVLSYELVDQKQPLSILELADRTGMTADDIVAALEGLRALVRDPITHSYALRLDYRYFRQCIAEWESKRYVTLNPDALVWTPYIMGRSNLAHYETAPPLPTIAPREDEDNDKEVPPEEGVQQTAKASESAVNSSEDTQPRVNGHTSDSADNIDKIDPALTQLQTNAQLLPPASNDTPAKSTYNGSADTPNFHPTPSIPPIRYEVFPPIPSTVTRRRGGWRGGPRKSATNGMSTPIATPSLRRAGTGLGIGKDQSIMPVSQGPKGGSPSSSTRRTRLGGALIVDEAQLGNADEDEGEGADPEAEEKAEKDVVEAGSEPDEQEEDEQDGEVDDEEMEEVVSEAVADGDFDAGEEMEGSEAGSESEAVDD